MKKLIVLLLGISTIFILTACGNNADEVNIYTTRHYDSDDLLYEEFTEQTGIKVNVVTDKAAVLIEKIKAEGETPQADLFFTSDAGYLSIAKSEGILQSVSSEVLNENIPSKYRDTDSMWFGLTKRARVFLYDINEDPTGLTYENVTSMFPNEIIVRSSSNIYNQSLVASMVEVLGESETETWVADLVSNFARIPEGNDREQAVAITEGFAKIAIANSYYYGKLVDESDETSKYYGVSDKVGIYFPNQGENETGVHVNISGAGVINNAKNSSNAVKLIEFLSSKDSQESFSSANYEFPVNPSAKTDELLQGWLDAQGITELKEQDINLTVLGINNQKAVLIMTNMLWDNPSQFND